MIRRYKQPDEESKRVEESLVSISFGEKYDQIYIETHKNLFPFDSRHRSGQKNALCLRIFKKNSFCLDTSKKDA